MSFLGLLLRISREEKLAEEETNNDKARLNTKLGRSPGQTQLPRRPGDPSAAGTTSSPSKHVLANAEGS